MELSRTKRILLGISLIAIVIGCFVTGYFLANVKPSKQIYTNELDEVVSYLDKYYYKDIDMDEFTKKYVEAGVDSLNDPYTYIYYEETTNTNKPYTGFGMGVSKTYLGLKIGSIYTDSPAKKAGLAVGDFIIGVDDLTIEKNKLDEINNYLGSAKEEITLHMLRNYKAFDVKIKKDTVTPDPLVSQKLIDNIGYIKINEFTAGAYTSFKKALDELEEKNITGLIIDVRNNPGGYASEVAQILQLFLTGSDSFLILDGKDSKTPTIYRPNSTNVKKSYDIKVLIDENSASASEVFALAMNRVMNYDLIGVKTFGKGVFQNDIKLETIKNAYLHVTLGYWYGPNKECIDKKGIEATVEVKNDNYTPFIIDNNTYSIDDCNSDIENIELMSAALGYTGRTDGYFGSDLESYLEANYSSNTLTVSVKNKVLEDYNNYLSDYNNDKVITKAIDLLK